MNDTKRNDGGSAFPQLTNDYIDRSGSFVSGVSGGMTLRDWFAGQALVGMGTWSPGKVPQIPEDKAQFAYELADAMLAAREASR